jgi:hypothetical protein
MDPDPGGPKTYEDLDPEHRFRHFMRMDKDSFRRKLVDKVAEIFRLPCILNILSLKYPIPAYKYIKQIRVLLLPGL